MDTKKIEMFRQLLTSMRTQIMSSGVLTSKEDLSISTDDLADEADLASNVTHQQIQFDIKKRELLKLKQIDQALFRIKSGTYGHCEECDAEIGEKRLKTYPWTTLCILHAEEQERVVNKFVING